MNTDAGLKESNRVDFCIVPFESKVEAEMIVNRDDDNDDDDDINDRSKDHGYNNFNAYSNGGYNRSSSDNNSLGGDNDFSGSGYGSMFDNYDDTNEYSITEAQYYQDRNDRKNIFEVSHLRQQRFFL